MITGKLEVNEFWKEIVNAMTDGLMVVANDGTIVMVNRSFERISGYSEDEIVGKSCSQLSCDACDLARKARKKKWCILFDKGCLTIRRCTVRRKDGSLVTVIKDGTLLKDSNQRIVGAVETIADLSQITERDEAIEELCRIVGKETGFYGMVGESRVMREVFLLLKKAAQSDAPVLIYGESGTGKELAAKAIHQLGWRREGPYVQLNCAALNDSLLESELFGHVKGAFTGAYRNHKGRFEIADGGDIFLDEIADVPLSIQVKLLRVLETKQFERVGDSRSMSVDVRIIAASNRDLNVLVKKKRFREDFFFRINVIPVHLPPLRDRKEDIPALVDHFVRLLRASSGKKISGLKPESLRYLLDYSWPGNVRELKSVMEYAFVVADKGMISPSQLPPGLIRQHKGRKGWYLEAKDDSDSEKIELLKALEKSEGNQTRAAHILGVSRVTVWHRMKKYGIDLKSALSSLND